MVERTIGGERSREWADRPPLSTSDAAGELRTLESQGVLEPRASRAVLVAAGHGEEEAPVGPRPANPGGLARREVDVLRLAAKRLTTRRLTTKQIADRLFISTELRSDEGIGRVVGCGDADVAAVLSLTLPTAASSASTCSNWGERLTSSRSPASVRDTLRVVRVSSRKTRRSSSPGSCG